MREFIASLLLIITSWFTGKPAEPIQPTPVIISPTVTLAPTPTPSLDLGKDSYPDPDRKGWRRVKIGTEVGDIYVSYPEGWRIERGGYSNSIFLIYSDDYKFPQNGTLVSGGYLWFTGSMDEVDISIFNILDSNKKYEENYGTKLESLKRSMNETKFTQQKLADLNWVSNFGMIEGDPVDNNKYYYSSFVNVSFSGECTPAKQDFDRIVKTCDSILDTLKFDFNK